MSYTRTPQMENGAVDETRTRDLHLGKVALYQLSYYRIPIRCGRRDLNPYAVWHQNLNLARLPIPPRPQVGDERAARMTGKAAATANG